MTEYGLIGEKLGHSFSKDIHSLIADYEYNLIELSPEELPAFLTGKNFKGVNVTIPYKHSVIPFLDEITPQARAIGAVNCIRNMEGKLIGHNPDFDGLKALLDHAGIDAYGKKALIAGTGGTSDTAAAVLRALNAAEVVKLSRNRKEGAVTYSDAYLRHGDGEIIINTTPCGMYPGAFESPLELDKFSHLEGVVDVIYNPLRSRLVSEAAKRKLRSEGGLYMLVVQAVKASEFFLSKEYPEETCGEIYKKIYNEKCNIVLTGMPSCGKTTIGNILAEKLGRKLIDTDDMVVKNCGMKITDIFLKYGEKYFRDAESQVIREASLQSGIIISTGGGTVLREENVDALRLNGRIFFIDRKPELLTPTADRPTAADMEQIEKRYHERYRIYTDTADFIVENNGNADEAAAKIAEELR